MPSTDQWWQPGPWEVKAALKAARKQYPRLIAKVQRVAAAQEDTGAAIAEVLASLAARPQDFEEGGRNPKALVESLFRNLRELTS